MAESNRITSKVCTRCTQTLPATSEHFNKNKKGLFGFSAECRPCFNKRALAYRTENPEREKARLAAYRAKNAEAIKARRLVAYHADIERQRARALEWYRLNAERSKALKRVKHKADPSAATLRKQQYKARNPNWEKEYYRHRRATDPKYRVSKNMSGRIRECLLDAKSRRSWVALVGFGVETLRAHLERQFLKGMSWDNYGEWHIDHIIPVASFNFTSASDPDFKACWALSNLRPLWGSDNVAKGSKVVLLL